MRVAVLASHEGTTLQSLIDACSRTPELCLVLVVSNNIDSGALQRARTAGISWVHLSGRTHPDPERLDEAVCEALKAHEAELVVLAGYMKKVGPRTLSAFDGRILNTHPALLPRFGGQGMFGLHVHRAVLDAGEHTTGASVHIVTAEYDAGPVIAQREVPVGRGDTAQTLGDRVQAVERELLVEVVRDVACGDLVLEAGSRVIRRAHTSDVERLTAIAHAAKRHWGYPEELIALWREGLTLTEGFVRRHPVYCATEGSRVVGFYALVHGREGFELEHMWVDPAHIGRGVGRLLLRHATSTVGRLGGSAVRIASDPHAEAFYERMGARRVAEVPSTPEGRTLPLLVLPVPSHGSMRGTGRTQEEER